MPKKNILLALALTIVTAISVHAQQLKFGHFDSEAFLSSLPEAKSVEKVLNDEQSKMENQLVALQEDFQKQVQDYQQKANTMTAEQAQAKEAELTELQQRIYTFRQTSLQDLQKKQQELIQPILQKIRAAVEQVGANNGFIYIFERSVSSQAILFNGTQSVDVTPLVKKQLGIN